MSTPGRVPISNLAVETRRHTTGSRNIPLGLLLAGLLIGCGVLPSEDSGAITTGLTGLVTRGPITPVCFEGTPCDAPFAGQFEVLRGSRLVATFRSDALGHFLVHLAPGRYTVVPGRDAPIMMPWAQRQEVEVKAEGLTRVVLQFDTGIR